MSSQPSTVTNDEFQTSYRRVFTTHDPTDTNGDNVIFYDDNVPLRLILDDNAAVSPLYSSVNIPSHNPHHITPEHINAAVAAVPGVVLPGGAQCSVTVLKPGFRVGTHRTRSIDYNVFQKGSAWLIVPDGKGGEKRTEVKAGEVVVQTGTLHGWEAGPEGAQWVTVVVAADPVEKDGQKFEDVDF